MHASPPATLACFDFDGTLTRKDTMLAFSQFVHSPLPWSWRMVRLSPTLAAYALRLIPNDVAKERFLSAMFGGMPLASLHALGEAFCRQQVPGLLRPAMMERLAWHREQGHAVMLVTASLSCWTAAFAHTHGMLLASSVPAAMDGLFTGRLSGKNCYGPEKVVRIRQTWEAHFTGMPLPEARFAYGDSRGDREMLAWAGA